MGPHCACNDGTRANAYPLAGRGDAPRWRLSRLGRELSGEGQVVQPGDAEHGLVNAVALEAAVPQDLPGAPRQTRSVPVPADRAPGPRRSELTTPLEEDGLPLAMRADARGAAADSDQHTLRAGIRPWAPTTS